VKKAYILERVCEDCAIYIFHLRERWNEVYSDTNKKKCFLLFFDYEVVGI